MNASARGGSCPACGAAAPADQRFCGQCGAALGRACPACGADNPVAHRFCGSCGAQLEPGTSAAAPPGEERRWASVLFADLSGFTSISERMDPEDVKALAHHCSERLAEEVRRFGGTVINVMGDAVLAVFGAPLAHEDDAERAVRAGLAIRECSLSPAESPAPGELTVHVGINTGEVMAGLLGPQERRDYTVMGDAVNTAARLMSAAPAGTVLVGEETYRATSGRVRYRQMAPVEAKGKERPVSAWEAVDAAPIPEPRPLGTAPLVGRDEELALLSGIWTKVLRETRPQLVTILGEPGIGKSRLVAEVERQALSGAWALHGRCLPYGEALGYWALATALKEAARVSAEDDAETARAKLGELVAAATGPLGAESEAGELARHVALLIGLDTEDDRSAQTADQRTLHASLRRVLEALARRRPLCLLLDDIHWADDALLDLIEFVAARAHEAPLLIVAQARPELLEKRPAWGRGVRAFTSLSLEPLGEREAGELISALCRERGLPDSVADQVGRGAGGNPLFAEELVATVAERGGAAGIPSAIKGLISARLDSLPADERRAVQLAAVFGKHFWEGGLEALRAPGDPSTGSGQAVADLLEGLELKDLVRSQPRSRFRGDREYSFKHDLIRDVAYETLPRAERRSIHGQAVDWIERVGGDRAEELLDLLAHHAVQADQPERALDYLTRAAERARRAAAHREEAALLAQALGIAETQGDRDLVSELHARRGRAFAYLATWAAARPELEAALAGLSAERRERRAEVLGDLAMVCFWSLDTPAVRQHATEALALAEELGRGDLATAAMGWLAGAQGADGNVQACLAEYERAIDRARQLGIPFAPALMQFSLQLYWTGQLERAAEQSREAVQAARQVNDTSIIMYALPHHGLALAASGRYDEAIRVFEEARRFGREHGIEPLLARSIAMSAGLHLDLFDFVGAEALQEEARALARSHNFPPPVVSAGIDLLLNLARRREVGRAEGLLEEVAESAATAAGWHGWLWKLRLAEARAEIALARGDWEEALRWAAEAIELSRSKLRVKYEALGLGTRAQALAALGRTKEAIADLQRAVELARPVGDPAMFLRPATALLAMDGDDALASEARAAAKRISAAVPDPEMRRRFEEAEPMRRLMKA